jgi:hypothetical protein
LFKNINKNDECEYVGGMDEYVGDLLDRNGGADAMDVDVFTHALFFQGEAVYHYVEGRMSSYSKEDRTVVHPFGG